MVNNEVVIWTGAGQIGMAIARRVGYGKKILVGDKSIDNATASYYYGPLQPEARE